MKKTAMAIGTHPDDIEFQMAGTLLLLKNAGYEIHYMTVANGSCGSDQFDRSTLVSMRRAESIAAAKLAGAIFHESIVDDLAVFYDAPTLAKLSAVVREVSPEIILTQHPEDYMEDHSATCRLAVMAAFSRGMPNYETDPHYGATKGDVALYHAPPHGLHTQLKRLVMPELFVDIASVCELKSSMLAAHKSQKKWLDSSQGMDSYVNTMRELCSEIGRLSGRFNLAEGWTRHLHMGLSSKEFDPLASSLGAFAVEKESGKC